jgi:hypothetical protein
MPYLKKATDTAFGLAPYTVPLRIGQYVKASTTNFFAGDIAIMDSAGEVVPLATLGGAQALVVGVSAETALSASAGTSIQLYDHPDQLFVIQEDSDGTALSQTLVGNVFQVTGLTPGTAAQVTRGRSITELDTSTGVATAIGASMIQLIKMHEIEGTTMPTGTGDQRKVVVKFLAGSHFYATQSGAI